MLSNCMTYCSKYYILPTRVFGNKLKDKTTPDTDMRDRGIEDMVNIVTIVTHQSSV